MTSSDLPQLAQRINRGRVALATLTAEARLVATTGTRLQREVADLTADIDLHTRLAGLLARIGEERQEQAQQQIETLVTQGLRTIFGDELSFHLVPGTRAKTPVVDFVVRSTLPGGTIVDTDVMDARGGGLAATVGFLLRLVVLLLTAGNRDTVLFLDETFAHVSAEYETRLAEFIRDLVDKTGVQVVMVTHSDAFTDGADVRYRFDLKDGVTRVQQV